MYELFLLSDRILAEKLVLTHPPQWYRFKGTFVSDLGCDDTTLIESPDTVWANGDPGNSLCTGLMGVIPGSIKTTFPRHSVLVFSSWNGDNTETLITHNPDIPGLELSRDIWFLPSNSPSLQQLELADWPTSSWEVSKSRADATLAGGLPQLVLNGWRASSN